MRHIMSWKPEQESLAKKAWEKATGGKFPGRQFTQLGRACASVEVSVAQMARIHNMVGAVLKFREDGEGFLGRLKRAAGF